MIVSSFQILSISKLLYLLPGVAITPFSQIDSLDTLALLGDRERFAASVEWIGKNLRFDIVSNALYLFICFFFFVLLFMPIMFCAFACIMLSSKHNSHLSK